MFLCQNSGRPRLFPALLVFSCAALGHPAAFAGGAEPVKPGPASAVRSTPPKPGNEVTVNLGFVPPPMRLAAENPPARTPPRLPRIHIAPSPTPSPSPSPSPSPETTSAAFKTEARPETAAPSVMGAQLKLGTPLGEVLDFFRWAGRNAPVDPVSGALLDPTFQPAAPPPTSSATYEVR